MFTVKASICGCSLRTGTWIILVLSFIMAFGSFFRSIENYSENEGIIVLVYIIHRIILMGVIVVAIYGILRDSPSFLKPFLIVSLIDIVLIIILMVMFLLVRDTAIQIMKVLGFRMYTNLDRLVEIVYYEVPMLMTIVISLYSLIIVYSFYKDLQGEL